jgi:hypothetical protein
VKSVTDRTPDSKDPDKNRQFQNMERECTVSQVLLWLWDGDSLGTQEGERPPLEAGTRGLIRDSRPRGLSACYSELQTVRRRYSA